VAIASAGYGADSRNRRRRRSGRFPERGRRQRVEEERSCRTSNPPVVEFLLF
jgi:hypothetical protein